MTASKPAAKKAAKKQTGRKPGRQPTDRKPKADKTSSDGGKVVKVELSKLTNRDIIDFEETTGLDIDDALAGGNPTYKQSCALYWLGMRQADPTLTFDQVLDIPVVEMRTYDIEIVDDPPES